MNHRRRLPAHLLFLLLTACSTGGSTANGPDGVKPDGPTGPGGFSSVWQAAKIEVTVYDRANPTKPEQRTIDVPALMKAPASDKNVTLYVTFEGDERVTYARYEDSNVHYRITHPALRLGDGDGAQYAVEKDLYTLEDGVLTQTSAREDDGTSMVLVTKFHTVAFPPAGWPTERIDQDAKEVSP